MNRCIIHRLSAMTALGLSLSGAAHAQSANQLVGTWKSSSSVEIARDGTRTNQNFTGRLIFDSAGNCVFIKTDPDIPKFVANNKARGTPAENRAVVIGTTAYFGTYSVSGNILTQKIEGATYPNWRGTEQKYTITLITAGELRYTVASAKGGQIDSIWKRMN